MKGTDDETERIVENNIEVDLKQKVARIHLALGNTSWALLQRGNKEFSGFPNCFQFLEKLSKYRYLKRTKYNAL